MRRLLISLAFMLTAWAPAMAQETGPLRIEVGKAQLLRPAQPPTVVVLGDPSIADVVIESGGVLFLLGLQVGETNLYLLDSQGEEIMTRDLVVTPSEARHVTLHRGVEEATLTCNPRCAGVANPLGEGAVAATNQATAAGAPAEGEAAAGAGAPGAATTGDTEALVNSLNSLLGATNTQ